MLGMQKEQTYQVTGGFGLKDNWNLDCEKVNCEWYDGGKGYEECKFCNRFSRSVSSESGLRSSDRYSPLPQPTNEVSQ